MHTNDELITCLFWSVPINVAVKVFHLLNHVISFSFKFRWVITILYMEDILLHLSSFFKRNSLYFHYQCIRKSSLFSLYIHQTLIFFNLIKATTDRMIWNLNVGIFFSFSQEIKVLRIISCTYQFCLFVCSFEKCVFLCLWSTNWLYYVL